MDTSKASLAFSKYLGGNLFGHLNLAYEQVNDAKSDEGDGEDEQEFEYGVALAYEEFADGLDLLLEFKGEYEKEETADGSESRNALYLAPGLAYEFENELVVGIDVVFGLNDDSYDFGSIVKVAYEF